MADKKISQLTAATTPLAGTEEVPLVQSGTTKKVTVADLTSGRSISGSAVTASTGNFIVGTAGKGVDFSINPSAAGMTSELLNDYEEGTWTPTGNAVTYSPVSGKYTKIGRFVLVDFAAEFPVTASTDDAVLGSFPFAFSGIMPGVSIGYTTYGAAFAFFGNAGDTYVQIRNFSGVVLKNVDFSGKVISGTVVYMA